MRPNLRHGVIAAIVTPVALTATLAAAAAQTAPVPDADQALLTIPQAMTIAEVTQNGTAFDIRRGTAGDRIVYVVKVSTPDRGVVDVQVQAHGGRFEARPHGRD